MGIAIQCGNELFQKVIFVGNMLGYVYGHLIRQEFGCIHQICKLHLYFYWDVYNIESNMI